MLWRQRKKTYKKNKNTDKKKDIAEDSLFSLIPRHEIEKLIDEERDKPKSVNKGGFKTTLILKRINRERMDSDQW